MLRSLVTNIQCCFSKTKDLKYYDDGEDEDIINKFDKRKKDIERRIENEQITKRINNQNNVNITLFIILIIKYRN